MSLEHNPTYLEDLMAEQALVQSRKCQTRLLEDYNYRLFPGTRRKDDTSCAMGDFLEEFTRGGELSVAGILNGMHLAKQRMGIHWADMGGGHGSAMRELGSITSVKHNLQMTNVDLFEYGDELFLPDDLSYLDSLNPGILKPESSPDLLRADIQTVELTTKADFITSIEAIQYLDDPIAALCNWYNNLHDNGVMVVSQDPELAQWIRFDQTTLTDENYSQWPTTYLVQELARSAIRFATSKELDWFPGQRRLNTEDFRTIAIQRKPGTKLVSNASVTNIWVSPNDHKAVYYERTEPLIVVEHQEVLDISTFLH